MIAKMPLATRRRALELGAGFIEHDLNQMRAAAIRAQETASRCNNDVRPITTSHEGDLMKAAEWASAIAILRALAEQEPRP